MKTLLTALIMLVLPASSLWANELPALFDVVSVEADDVLNVREDPMTGTPIIATLAFNERDVEVIAYSDNKRWGLVNAGETSGWVSMRYLMPVPGIDWTQPSARLRCGGTEPFWNFATNAKSEGSGTFLAMVENTPREYGIDWHGGQIARFDHTIGLGGARKDTVGGFSAVIRREECHDGMSDMNFGLAIDLFLHGNGETEGYEGCCSLLR